LFPVVDGKEEADDVMDGVARRGIGVTAGEFVAVDGMADGCNLSEFRLFEDPVPHSSIEWCDGSWVCAGGLTADSGTVGGSPSTSLGLVLFMIPDELLTGVSNVGTVMYGPRIREAPNSSKEKLDSCVKELGKIKSLKSIGLAKCCSERNLWVGCGVCKKEASIELLVPMFWGEEPVGADIAL
jgi:hypothetical protein